MLKTWHLTLALVVLSLFSVFLGVSSVSLSGLLDFDRHQWEIFTISRIPRLVAILITGAGLAVCGLIMQNLANNKFVSPTTAGTISSAKLGILISIFFFPQAGLLTKAAFASVVAFIGSLVFIKILRSLKITDIIFVPLIGIMFAKIIDSTEEYFAYKWNLLQIISTWVHGNFSLVIEGRYELLYLTIPALALTYLYAQKFTLVGMGEDSATTLGINYSQVLYIGLALTAIVTALVVTIAGSISFIGLIIPNIVSMYLGDNVKKTLMFTAVLGALFVLACDVLARLFIYPYEVSVGAVSGSIGAAIFLYLIYRRYRHG